MSNYNTTLQSNNTDLQAILNTINGLPNAGGEQATPVISVNTSGLITATAGTKSSTHQLAFQAAKTITPTTTNQTAVSSGYYTGGAITVKGDSNLVAGNIKSGVSIFGVNGTFAGSGGGDTSNEDGLVARTLTSYTNDRVTTVGYGTFAYASSLTTASFPAATTIGSYAFYNCSSLTTASFPTATTIGSNAFYGCFRLTTASFPVATSIGSNAFRGCSSLTTASFPEVTSISNYAFHSCYNLKSLYLTNSKVCTLSHSNAFSSTPIGGYSTSAGTYGSIYVPTSLLASYKKATNWTYFSSRFVGI
jgi:hypothetical protein